MYFMKKNFLILLSLVFTFASCEPLLDAVYVWANPDPTISIDAKYLSLSYTGEAVSETILFSINQKWTATSSDSWISFKPSQGRSGIASLTITISENPSDTETRKGEVTITANGAKKTISVTQLPKDSGAGNTKIYYTSTDEQIVTPYRLQAWDKDGEELTYTNTYEEEQGVIEFAGRAKDIDLAFSDPFAATSETVSKIKTFKRISNHVFLVTGKATFYNCQNLISVDLKNISTSKVTDMKQMFSGCKSLTSLDLSRFDTENVTNMSYMFVSCHSLTSINLSGFNTSNVVDMVSMFSSCPKLSSLDLKHFNTEKVTNMQYMFYSCTSLNNLDISSFNTSKVTKMDSMFWYCKSLESLNLSSFDTSNVTDMTNMFGDCYKLSSIDAGAKTNASSVTPGCDNISTTGILYYPIGTDYSNWLNVLPEGWEGQSK